MINKPEDGLAPQAELDATVLVHDTPTTVDDAPDGSDDLLTTLLSGTSGPSTEEKEALSDVQMEEALFPNDDYVPGTHGPDDSDLFGDFGGVSTDHNP